MICCYFLYDSTTFDFFKMITACLTIEDDLLRGARKLQHQSFLQMQSKKSKMVVFLSTQDSVEFHHRLFSQVLISGAKKSSHLTEDEDNVLPGTKDESETATLFKLHGEMSQKVSSLFSFIIYSKCYVLHFRIFKSHWFSLWCILPFTALIDWIVKLYVNEK